VATILTFSTGRDPRGAAPRHEARAEVIVFPRTDIRALHRWSERGTDMPRPGDPLSTVPGDDSQT